MLRKLLPTAYSGLTYVQNLIKRFDMQSKILNAHRQF